MKEKVLDKTAPKTLSEFYDWAATNLSCDFNDPKSKRLYEINLSNIYNSVSNSPFFKGLLPEMEKWENVYITNTKSSLFMEKSLPRLLQKPYESAVDKAFRTNVIWNNNFPEPPKKGWVTTDNLFYTFNDLVRCSIVCKFIDGPRFVTDRLMLYAKSLDLERRRYTQERDEGYYAYHFYVKFSLKFVDKDWQELIFPVETEIQVTTQLQEVLRTLTHSYYKESRVIVDQDSSEWKWDFGSNRFRVGYLSHTLHLLESIILESRNEVSDEHMNDTIGKESNNG